MKFARLTGKKHRVNVYIVFDEQTLDAVVIDPGELPPMLVPFLQQHSLRLKGIILTHHHRDHIEAVEELRKLYDCPVYIHQNDAERLKKMARRGLGLLGLRIVIEPDILLKDGDTISVGAVALKVVHTPGHTPGSICLEVVGENIIFTGDTIFANGIGRTDFTGGDERAMIKSLSEIVNHWADEVRIYPGHGLSTDMANVRVFNGLFRMMIEGIDNSYLIKGDGGEGEQE